jgi:hypothetical protein
LIGSLNGHDPSIIKVDKIEGGIAQVSYNRPSDGTGWTSQCRAEGDRIIWRAVDSLGPGSGVGRWREHPDDEVTRFSLAGSKITITTTYLDGSGGSDEYTIR